MSLATISGHGKTAFLKALAQKLPANATTGSVTYQGLTQQQAIEKNIYLGHLVQYVGMLYCMMCGGILMHFIIFTFCVYFSADQLDQHLPFLTVRETMDFVHQNANVDPAMYEAPELSARHERRVDDVLDLLHLQGMHQTELDNIRTSTLLWFKDLYACVLQVVLRLLWETILCEASVEVKRSV